MNKTKVKEFSVENLNLTFLYISKLESFYLENFLKRCKHLKFLYIAGNCVGIFKSLKYSAESLEIIDLNYSSFTDEDFENLINILPNLKNIQYICLSGNRILMKNLEYLHEIVKKSKTIKNIQLPDQREIENWMKEANTEFEQGEIYITKCPYDLKNTIE